MPSASLFSRARVIAWRCYSIKKISRAEFSTSLFTKMYNSKERGAPNTVDYRMYFYGSNGPISPFHDIPLFANKESKIYNMVVEIPRWTNAKMEIATKEPLNPIKQDTKKGQLRYVHNIFPHHGYIWNYGCIPQTWEDPFMVNEFTSCKGDNDPIDVCEIGSRVANRGDILQVKVLGIMALIDEGETDWKVVAIDTADPLSDKLEDIDDVEKHFPGLLKATNEWFRFYKVPAGKPENKIAFGGEFKAREFAEKIILETHESWKDLMKKSSNASDLSCLSLTIEDSPHKIESSEAAAIVEQSPKFGSAVPIDGSVNKWHYIEKN